MSESIDAFGGDGEYQVRFRTGDEPRSVWVRRDVWVDRGDGERWVVWAHQRSWDGDQPPAEHDAEGVTLGSIVVTDPVAKAFLEQLGALIANPASFGHEPEFSNGLLRSDDGE
jgi:hypothetical protein